LQERRLAVVFEEGKLVRVEGDVRPGEVQPSQ
jgi:hypothetical protein